MMRIAKLVGISVAVIVLGVAVIVMVTRSEIDEDREVSRQIGRDITKNLPKVIEAYE